MGLDFTNLIYLALAQSFLLMALAAVAGYFGFKQVVRGIRVLRLSVQSRRPALEVDCEAPGSSVPSNV